MQRNFILTDVMRTGDHLKLEQFISMNSMKGQRFEMTGDYYMLHNYDLDSYDRRFAIIDVRKENYQLQGNTEFSTELKRRCELLHSQGFVFIKSTPWESLDTIAERPQHPQIDIPHVKWSGGVSWFWFYMFQKHKGKRFEFVHTDKKYDFLYLNKRQRPHREKLFNRLKESGTLDNSLYTKWPDRKLPPEYELPWAQDYPNYGMDQDIYEKPYNDTACSIVSETNDNNDEVFMTEKIWKPIIAQQLFIVHGNGLYLQRLREMGFKTFSNYFDESYDLVVDRNKRIETIVDVCAGLRNASWQDIYLQSQALRQHNYTNFFDKEKLAREINKTLQLFLEFADGSEISS
jgi:hypothetical protein